mgnify:CR=1 FL=1
MGRVYNFSAGPAVLPEEVLKEAADEMLDYKGTGMSVMEMSHRSKAYDEIIKDAEKDIRDLMNIPDNYKVLFLQGGASQQFAAVPMNLMKNKKAAYIITGQWAKKAYQEAQIYGEAVSLIFRIVPILIFRKTLIMFTSVKIIQFTVQSSRNFLILRARLWLPTFLHASFQSLLTLLNTALFTAAFRRISVLPALLSQLSVRISSVMTF